MRLEINTAYILRFTLSAGLDWIFQVGRVLMAKSGDLVMELCVNLFLWDLFY